MTDYGSMLIHALKQVLYSSKGAQVLYHLFVITNLLKPIDNRLSVTEEISLMMLCMLFRNLCRYPVLYLYTLPSSTPQKITTRRLGIATVGASFSWKFFFWKRYSRRNSMGFLDVWRVTPSCCSQHILSYYSSESTNW